jgi:HPt (histidine-containing phosphotransfer) domain-containing protein
VQPGIAKAAEIAYEEVRQSFRVRLRAEQARLTTLTEVLGSVAGNPATAFGDLEGFAHRLRGAAAVFDYPELRDVAKTLEQAACAAVVLRSSKSDPLVQNAMRILAARLTCMNEAALPPEVAMVLAPTN